MRFHHIGIACKDIKQEIPKIAKIHKIINEPEIIHDSEQNADLCYIETEDSINIELISGPQVENILNKNISFYHVCYEVENIAAKIGELVGNGAMVVSAPKPAILFSNKTVAFLLVQYGLIELIEK